METRVTPRTGRKRAWPLPVFGLTGSIASGKTTLAEELGRCGAAVIDADRVGHAVLRRGNPPWRRVRAEFGRAISLPDGRMGRGRLGAVVFAGPAARARLEAILHPAIEEALRVRVGRLARSRVAIVVIEAALLPESGLDRTLDGLAVVMAGKEAQMERLVRDRGLDPEEARERISAQWSGSRKAERATWVIENDGTIADLRRKAAGLFGAMRSHPAAAAVRRRSGRRRGVRKCE